MKPDNVWFRFNKGQFWVEFRPQTPLGCVIVLLLFLLCFCGSIFLVFKFYSLVFPILLRGLGISVGFGIVLLVTVIFGTRINFPLYLVAVENQQVRYALFPVWLLKVKQPAYKAAFQPHTFVGINLIGGLMPLGLALYQLNRTSPRAILIVTAIVTLMSYCLVRVVPGVRIYFKRWVFGLVILVTALSALWIATETHSSSLSIAFAGGVLGTLIGADLLHLKDIQPEKAIAPLNIGGAGLDDGVALCGLYSLLLAEWLPKLAAFLMP